jgi:hypothetical protein
MVLHRMAFTSIITVLAALIAGSSAFAGPGTQPVHQTNCFAAPHVCGFPDASNTGVPKGMQLKPSGSVEVTEDGAVIKGLEVTGTIEIDADDVTIEDTKVTLDGEGCGSRSTCGNYDVHIEDGATGTVIRDSEFLAAPGTTCEHTIRNSAGPDMRLIRVYMNGCDSNIYGGGTLKDSYGLARIAIADDHVENVYMDDSKFIAIHDTLLNPVGQTAVVFGDSNGGEETSDCRNRITILSSLIAGGGYSIYPCAHAEGPGTSKLTVEGNHFARCKSKEGYEPDGGAHPCVGGPDSFGYYPNSGSYGVMTDYFAGAAQWRNNVWDDNLQKLCIDGRSAKRCGRR